LEDDTGRFVVLTSGRTGSTFVRLWLDSHPSIRSHGEVFLRAYGAMDGFMHYCRSSPARRIVFAVAGHRRLSRRSWNLPLRTLTRGFLRRLLYDPEHSAPWTDMETWNDYQPRSHDAPEETVGFKLGYSHLRDFSYIGTWLERESVGIVHLVREDPLAQLVSRRTAMARGVFHSTGRVDRVTVELDPDQVLSTLRRMTVARASMSHRFSGPRFLEISYEGFFGESSDSVRSELLGFLGVSRNGVTPPSLRRMNRAPLREMVENWEELVEALSGTQFERYTPPSKEGRPGTR